MDKFQERYLKHQERKKMTLTSTYGVKSKAYKPQERDDLIRILKSRCSQRVFNSEEIDENTLDIIFEAIDLAPSSCDRQGVDIHIVEDKNEKELLTGFLVGGVGWVHRADKVLILTADMECYKSPVEKVYMPYLDAGVLIQTVYLVCEVLNLGCCYINPNVRDEHKEYFNSIIGIRDDQIFCGALALGYYNLKHCK